MKRLFFLVFLLTNFYDAYPQGSPLFRSIRLIEYIANVTIIDNTIVNSIDTCLNGKIIKGPNQYIYKCRLIECFYGKITDSIFNLKYAEPFIEEYDDSCNVTTSYWYINAFSGIERNLIAGDKTLICFDSNHQIIAARKTNSEIDNFVINHVEDLKKVDRTICQGESIYAIGETKYSELCILKTSYESSVKEDIPTVFLLHDGKFQKYMTHPNKLLENINSSAVWKFKIKKRKIIIHDKGKKYKLLII